jgi:hypothetical protein
MPAWLVTVLVALLFGGLLFLAYRYVLPAVNGASDTGQAVASAQDVPNPLSAAPATALKPHPYAKYLELTGFRISEDAKKKAQITLLVVNHAVTALDGLEMRVELYTDKSGPNDPPISTFNVTADTIPGQGSREFTEKIQTNLRAYELPDWQFLRAKFEILKPQL